MLEEPPRKPSELSRRAWGRRPSPSRFAWLLSPASSAPDGFKPAELEDAVEFMLGCWQVLPAMWSRFSDWIGSDHQRNPGVDQLRARSVAVYQHGLLQVRWIGRIAVELDRRSIDWTLLKSSAARFLVYDYPSERSGRDIDLAVARHKIEEARVAIQSLGFQPAQWDPAVGRFRPANRLLHVLVEQHHHELGFHVLPLNVIGLKPAVETAIRSQLSLQPNPWFLNPSNGQLGCYVIVDVHHGLSVDLPAEEVLSTSQELMAECGPVRVPNLASLLFHILFKLYWEGVHNYQIGAFQFADVCRLVPRLSGKDWTKLRQLLAAAQLEAAGYYVLRRLESDFSLKLRSEMRDWLEELRWPDRSLKPKSVNDLGDMWPKLWGHR